MPYAQQIKKCEEAERKLAYILQRCKNLKVDTKKPKDINTFLQCMSALKKDVGTADSMLFEAVEKDIAEKEKFVTTQTESLKELEYNYNTLQDFE